MHLTKTELEIVNALARGENSADISANRFRSQSTILKHIKNVRQKLGAKTAGQLIYLALKQGLIKSIFMLLMVSQVPFPVRNIDDPRADDKRKLRVTRSFSVRPGKVINNEV